jgi:type IX secretion system PorP/SprF family membrane protein
MKNIKIILVVLVFLTINVQSQDIHFSQFNDSPQIINPALTGTFITQGIDDNLLRIGANFKNQGASISVPYRTYSAYLDGSFSPKQLKKSQISFGLLLYNDNAGDGSLQNTSGTLCMAFTRGFNRLNTLTATLGFSLGFINRSIDISRLVFDNQWNGVVFDPSASSNENFSANSIFAFNFNFGALLKYKISNSFTAQIGSSLSHINKPRSSFYDSDNRINPKLIIHAAANISSSNNLIIEPAIMYSVQDLSFESILGSNIILVKRDVQLILGLWYRINRDIIPLAGLKYNGYKMSISYDVNISKLNAASNYRGGIEISLIKIFNKNHGGIECSDYQ